MPPIENEPACELAVDSVSRLDKQATVRRYGRAAFSFDMFEAPERYRWCETSCAPDGAVAFRRIYRSDIIIGEPLVPEEHYGQAFEEFVQTRPVGTCVVGYCCSDTFMNAALQKGAAAAQLISEIEFDPRQWSADAGAAKLRQNLRHARGRGLMVAELGSEQLSAPSFQTTAEALVKDWLGNAVKRPGHYHEVNLWRECSLKRYFGLFGGAGSSKLLGLLVARRIMTRRGYYLSVMRGSAGPTGVNEMLITKAIHALAADGAESLSFGPMPQSQPGLFHRMSPVFRAIYRLVLRRTGYEGTVRFYRKLGFGRWKPRYVVFWPPKVWLRPMLALSKLTDMRLGSYLSSIWREGT